MSAAATTRFFRDSVPGRRGEILDAAIDVFGRRGYDGGSMREIAEIVGVTEPAIYRHFDSKQALFEELLVAAGRQVVAEAGPLIDNANAQNLRATLDTIVEERRAALGRYVPVIQTAMVATVHNPEFLDVYRATIITPVLEKVAALVIRIDDELDVYSPQQGVAVRVRMFVSVFVGYFMTSMFIEDAEMPVTEAILNVMGWHAR